MLVDLLKTALRWKRQGAGETYSRSLLMEGLYFAHTSLFPGSAGSQIHLT